LQLLVMADRVVAELQAKLAAAEAESGMDLANAELLRDILAKANLHGDSIQQQLTASASANQRLRDEVADLVDCREHLRQLGKISGCNHVESSDERSTQVRHIEQAFDRLDTERNDFQQMLAEAKERVRYLERQSERDLAAARTLHPGVNSVGDMATIVGAKLSAAEEERDYERSTRKSLESRLRAATHAGTPYAADRDERNALIVANDKLEQRLADTVERDTALEQLAEAEARIGYLERQSDRDLTAARTLHPSVNSVGDMATIVGAKLAAAEMQINNLAYSYESCANRRKQLAAKLAAAEALADERLQRYDTEHSRRETACQKLAEAEALLHERSELYVATSAAEAERRSPG
jgi:hypothetical protein